ncbi:MAG: hypothetical protein ACJAUV_001715 [Flavobacteriales bacterium]|jgi:hypothetical protein
MKTVFLKIDDLNFEETESGLVKSDSMSVLEEIWVPIKVKAN